MSELATECPKLLVIDDEMGIRDGLSDGLRSLGYRVETASSGEEGVHQLRLHPEISFVLTDFKMTGLDGFDVLKEIRKHRPNLPVVVMTGFGSVHHAVQAMQLGASDYLCKPFRLNDLERIVVKALPKLDDVQPPTHLITQDPAMQELLAKAKRVAMSSAPILIEGPSGTGKELLARQIHEWSGRRHRPWVAVNCAALPTGLLESELFGFEKGAFTGAVEKKVGKFEQADAGTLLLDEIGELDLMLQAKLLRVLQEGEIDRLGGKKPSKVDVRILATTNRNLEERVARGLFREDLYFRLYGIRFRLPSLKDRPKDIAALAETFLIRQAEVQKRSLVFAPGVIEELQRHPWPGNIRELEMAVERAALLSESGRIDLTNFEFSPGVRRSPTNVSIQSFGNSMNHQKPIKDMERDIILGALESHAGNRTHTARALGMSLRTLRHKLKQYREEGISVEAPGQGVGKDYRLPSADAELVSMKSF